MARRASVCSGNTSPDRLDLDYVGAFFPVSPRNAIGALVKAVVDESRHSTERSRRFTSLSEIVTP
jgi:hypothetical protein